MKKKNILFAFLTFFLAVLVIAGGCAVMFFGSKYLFFTSDEIRNYEKSEQNSMLFADADGLVLYPWDVIDEEKDTPVLGIDEIFLSLLSEFSYSFPCYAPARNTNYDVNMRYNQENDITYIRNFRYSSEEGENFSLDYAARGGVPIYYHIKSEAAGNLTDSELEAANELLETYIDDTKTMILSDYGYDVKYGESSDSVNSQKYGYAYPDNANVFFLKSVSSAMRDADIYGYDIVFREIVSYPSNYYTVTYDDEIYLVMNSGDSGSVIFIYDPAKDAISGMSFAK